MTSVHAFKKGVIPSLLGIALVAMSGSAGAVDLFLVGADAGASATAAAECSYSEATGHGKAAGTKSASASSSATIDGAILTSGGKTSYKDGVATSDSYATGVGFGIASASASAEGEDGSTANASHSCDLRWLFESGNTDAALAPTYGCQATGGVRATTYQGAVRVDAVTGAPWFVGTVTREGETTQFATPVGDALVLTGAELGTLWPPTLGDAGVPFQARFLDGACESRLG